uniref:Uncharacterized protein n=1 Tax=Odontella aurita TaxID=265563 RepID=A0A7S4I441_9STRA|mmetsp:Transcript_19644/g.57124  ORF Transcript_19644/g.57124 Transcript_19644/m.57124 type:complete len:233 (+) Transcript_19644:202-900(+)
MEEWAQVYPGVRFLTVCVDAVGVAKQFGMMFGLNKAVNCYIPSRSYFPVGYGQLGCSGFVVSDKNGCFVSRKTMAYLDYGEGAFSNLEELLRVHFDQHKSHPESNTYLNHSSEDKKESVDEINDEPVPSVGINSMDSEHERCEEALSLLQGNLTSKSLENFLVELSAHFTHEEQLMKDHGFGNSSRDSGFSPLVSHVKDHERILDIGYRELERSGKKAQVACSSNKADGSSS